MTPGSNDRSNSRVAPQLASQEGSTILDIDGRAQPTRPTSLFQEVRNSSRQIIPENLLWVAANVARFSTWASNRPNPCDTKYPGRLRKPPTQTWIAEGSRQDLGFGRFFSSGDDPLQVLLYFPGVGCDGHRVVHLQFATDPTTEWTAQQLRDVVRFDRMRPYPLRDRLATSRTSHPTAALKRLQESRTAERPPRVRRWPRAARSGSSPPSSNRSGSRAIQSNNPKWPQIRKGS